jgi:heme-degrading monooxygenase HmoA
MHTLIIEGSFKAGKKAEFNTAWKNEILPTLKKQNGFVDEMLLFETTNPNRAVGLSFWKSKEEAERYQREVLPRIVDSVVNLIEGPPSVRSFDVEASANFRIAADKAA